METRHYICSNGDGKSITGRAAPVKLLISPAPVLINSIFATIRAIADQGTTVLLVEQDVNHSLRLSDRGYVLEHGRIAMEGNAKDLLGDPHLKEAYLGI